MHDRSGLSLPAGPRTTPLRRPLASPLGSLWVLFVVAMLMRASQNMAQTTFPLVARDLFHLHPSAVGLIAAGVSAVGGAAIVLLASRVTSTRAPQALVVAMGVMAVAFPFIGLARTAVVLVVGVVVLGLGGGVAFPTLITAVGATEAGHGAKGTRDRPIALLGVALSVSLAIGPFVETGVLDLSHGSLRSAFDWFTIAPLAAIAVLAVVLVRHRRGSPAAHSLAARPVVGEPGGPDGPLVVSAEPSTGAVAVVPSGARLALGRTLKEPAFKVALAGQLVYAAPFAALVVFGALLARHDDGMSPAAIEVAFGTFFVVSFLVRTVLVWRSPITRKLVLFRLGTFLTLLGTLLLGVGHGEALLFVAMAVLGVPHGLTFPLAMGLVAEDRPQGELASVNANLSASVQAVNLVLPLLLGVGIDAIGYRDMFLVLLAPVILAGAFQLIAARELAAHQHRVRQRTSAPLTREVDEPGPWVESSPRRKPGDSWLKQPGPEAPALVLHHRHRQGRNRP